jgi:cytochrome c oxidase subunit 2
MVAKQWDFVPSTITVNKGDTVKMIINSIDVKHGIAIPEFGVNSDLNPGEITTIEFVADKSGSFRFFCSVFCGSGHGSMEGTLIVN